jgi:metal-responsive CopG/Arc/MetJ family transcriptional regulator
MVENGKTLKFQKKLIEEVDRIIEERPDLFYRTRTDFVADAIRKHVAALSLEGKK